MGSCAIVPYPALTCAAQRGIRVDVLARILLQQVAVKHLEEVEPRCTWHTISPRRAPLRYQVPELRLEPPEHPELEEGSMALVLAASSPCC